MAKRILRVDSSMRKTGSVSRQLASELIQKLSAKNDVEVIHRDLADGVPIIDEQWVAANFTDPAERNAADRQALAVSDKMISELKSVDTLVIASPIYNFGVPAALKAWVDLICRARDTFKYTEHGPVGLLENKQAYIVLTSGGTQLGSELDFISAWLRHVLGFIGIDQVTFIDSTGQMISEKDALLRAQNEIARVA